MEPVIALESLRRRYAAGMAVDGIDLTVERGEFFSLLGPSGCGKTTTLRLIAGFDPPDSGRVRLEGRDVTHLPPQRRPLNTVFQNYALFPHLTVWENVAFGPRARGLPGADIRRRVAEGLVSRGGRFVTLVHPTAIIAPSATLGAGSIVCPFGIISDAALTGACVLVNYHASLAHGSSAADFAVLSPYSTLAGNARIGVDAFLGLHASVGPGRHLGDRTKVSANSSALTDSPPDSIVFGVPGRIAPLLD